MRKRINVNGQKCASGYFFCCRGAYMVEMKPVPVSEVERCYRANRVRRITIGKCVLSEKARRPRVDRVFSLELLRLREIEAIIRHRHGSCVPDPEGTDDRDSCIAYIRAAAFSRAGQDMADWCRRWAPWATDVDLVPILREAGSRRRMMRADGVAGLLNVTMAEREAIGLKTIGASDMTAGDRQALAKARKQDRDRKRQQVNRRAAGRQDRASYEAQSLSRKRPWVAEGISRRTWERRRVASLSRVDIDTNGDTLASKLAEVAASLKAEDAAGESRAHRGSGAKPPAGFQGAAPHGSRDTQHERPKRRIAA